MRATGYILVFVGLLIGAYIGQWWYISRDARARDNADALVSLFGRDGQCTVSRQPKGSQTSMPCSDVGRYLREHNIPLGGTVSIGVATGTSEATMKALIGSIQGAGLKIVDIMKVGFITEPEHPR